MKKLKISMLALVFTVGIGGAVVQKIHAAPKLDDPIYDWTPVSGSNFVGTVAQAQTHYGCSATARLCASGAIDPDSPVQTPATAQIKKN